MSRDTKIDYPNLAIMVEHQILRLDIAVNNSLKFKVVTGVKQDIRKQHHRVYRLHGITMEHLTIGFAVDEFFDDKEMLNSAEVFATEINDARDVRSANPLHCGNFPLRAFVARRRLLNKLQDNYP